MDAAQFLLDTDTCIYLLNGHKAVKARVEEIGVGATAVAMPTLAELYFGAHNSGHVEANLARVRDLLTPPCPAIISVDDSAAECFGSLKAALRRKGQPIGDFDLLIAGVAISRGLVLVTNNTGHFSRVDGLKLENWTTADAAVQATP